MTKPVKGAKFPLFLIDEEWKQLMEVLYTLPNEKWQPILSVYVKLEEQLEKLGVK